jgi:all-trans-retinol 13,14-reductase
MLAKNGYRVSVLEKNAQLGGCLQNFVRSGVKFETGMHYIGSMEEGQTLYRFFRYLSLLPDVKLCPLDKTAYDIISIAGERFSFANGKERFVESLAQRFPNERRGLQRYMQTIEDVAGQSPMYSLRRTDSLLLLNLTYVQQSASDFIASVTTNSLLQQVLAGNLPLYAGAKGKTRCTSTRSSTTFTTKAPSAWWEGATLSPNRWRAPSGQWAEACAPARRSSAYAATTARLPALP